MIVQKSPIAIAVLTAVSITGCGGSDNNSSNNDSDEPSTVSFQQRFLDSDFATDIIEKAPQLNSKYAAAAAEAKLASATSVDFADVDGFTGDDFYTEDFFDDTDYIGAVDPDADTAWWEGWTLHQGSASLIDDGELHHPLFDNIADESITAATSADCPAGDVGDGTDYPATVTLGESGETQDFPVCVIADDLTSSGAATVSLTNDHVYILDGIIHVGDQGSDNAGIAQKTTPDVTLNVAAGTQIFGATAKNSGLIVTRNSRINVNGTAERPVVMSSWETDSDGDYDDSYSGVDEWGGLVIDGYAPTNKGSDASTEVAPDGITRVYGGTEPEESSGSIEYLVVAESGGEFRPDEEIQGLTLEGVGNGTTIDHVQIHHSGDDGIEWFGGTVNAKHLVITGAQDDALDMDLGFQGGIQYALIRQADEWGDRLIESDNNGDDYDVEPITMPTFSNVTLIGNSNSENSTIGVLHREGMGGFFHKMIVTDDADYGDITKGCLDIDDTDQRIDEGNLRWDNVIMNCEAGSAVAADDTE